VDKVQNQLDLLGLTVSELQTIFGLDVDGIAGNDTIYLLAQLEKVTHFKLDEFRCQGCDDFKLNIHLLLKLEELRKLTGPLIINSGYRSVSYNASVGGIKNSEHIKGNAADIRAVNMSPYNVYYIADKMFNGVGRYATFTHVDVGENVYRWKG